MELQDYSGEFKPGLTMRDFSKEQLIKLIVVAAKGLVGIDGQWNTMVEKRYGWETAREMTDEVWTGKKNNFNLVQDLPRIREAFNIRGTDVEALFKYLQVTPTLGLYNWTMKFNLKNKNHGIVTVTGCKTLEYCERAKDDRLKNHVCLEMDTIWYSETAPHMINPKIKCNQLVPVEMRPRRTDSGQTLCEWEYILEE